MARRARPADRHALEEALEAIAVSNGLEFLRLICRVIGVDPDTWTAIAGFTVFELAAVVIEAQKLEGTEDPTGKTMTAAEARDTVALRLGVAEATVTSRVRRARAQSAGCHDEHRTPRRDRRASDREHVKPGEEDEG